ncbi:hypothetical protein ILUMI_04011 [Ignelater luminosus]|uniref:Uncharacterized protein n=1 Tax=Ignelater luminosus TaxID=2038154 RepID=A0A8K0DDE4_IGNLU|nr:hypothetical protein ILUMI_04011 [Ignelater luminosus]
MVLLELSTRMTRFIPVLLLCFVCYFVYAQALECGIVEQMEEDNIKNVLHKCMGKKVNEAEEKSEKMNKTSTESSEETEQGTHGARRGMTSKIKRSLFNMNYHKNKKILKRDTVERVQDEDDSKQNSNETTTQKCVLQCIFTDLGMVDDNGYPEHNRVAQGLLKNAKGRELRDFIQDSTDECFQLMEQGEKLDTCEYATHLVKCLAEKGRSNCADWQIMSVPFHT